MASEVKSYSIKEKDRASQEMVLRLEQYAVTQGISMSQLVLNALEHYENTLEISWSQQQNRKRLRKLG